MASPLINKNEDVSTEQALKEEISPSYNTIAIGEVELYPGKELALASIYDIGLVFELVKPKSQSKNYPIQHQHFQDVSKEKSEVENFDFAKCRVVKWEDFLRCTSYKIMNQKNELVLVEIISYVTIGVNKMNGKIRKRSVLRFTPQPPLDINDLQRNWIDRINLDGRKFVQRKYKCVKALSDEELLTKKRVLVLLNPFSGTRSALKIFHKSVNPFLRDAGIEFELFITERAGHAKERLQHENLEKWDALLFLSGDGLVHEALNGLLARDDANIAIQKPLGIIPCGSGNTMIGAILYYSHEEYSVLNAGFVFVKGIYGSTQSLDVCSYKQGSVTSYFFLIFNWGYLGDVVIQSEVIRRVGEIRFIVAALLKLLNRHPYNANISYLPFDDINSVYTDVPLEDVDETSWIGLEGPFTNLFITLVPMLSREFFLPPMHPFGSGHFTLVNLPFENVSRLQILKLISEAKQDDMKVFSAFSYTKIRAFRFTPIYPRNGILSVDGEVLPYETCYGELSPYKMCITSMFEKTS